MNDILRIGICDDEKVIHEIMTKAIEEYSRKSELDCSVTCYMSGVELIDSQDIEKLDVLFLDIEMPELDGVETAYKLNRVNNHFRIIMLTSKVERFKDAFKIGAFRFVTKPIEKSEVFEALDDVRNRMFGMKMLELHRDGRVYSVLQRNIVYVMSDRTSTYVFTKKYDYRSDASLTWWENELDNRLFVRCHKSYIVNVSKIANIDKNGIQLITGERLPVARRRFAEVEQRLMEYDTKYR